MHAKMVLCVKHSEHALQITKSGQHSTSLDTRTPWTAQCKQTESTWWYFLQSRRYGPGFTKQRSKTQVSQVFVWTVLQRWRLTVGHGYPEFQHSAWKIKMLFLVICAQITTKGIPDKKHRYKTPKHWHLLKTIHWLGNTLHVIQMWMAAKQLPSQHHQTRGLAQF